MQSYYQLGGVTADLLTHTLTTADGLVPETNRVYSFRFSARNVIGNSPYSSTLRVALGN